MRMIRTAVAGLVTALFSAVCMAAETPTQPQEQQSPRFEPARALEIEYKQDQLGRAHPGVGVSVDKGVGRIYGPAFGHGSSPTAAAEAFRLNDMPALGLPADQLRPGANFLPEDHPTGNTVPLMYDQATGRYKFTAVYYTQVRDGYEVWGSRLTLLVRNERNYPLVLAATALRELGNFHVDAAMTRRANPAAGFAAVRERLGKDAVIGATRQVIWAGIDDMVVQPALAFEFIGETDPNQPGYQKMLFLTDAATGAILHQENLIQDFVDIAGNVSGMATTGNGADICGGIAPMGMPYAKVAAGATTVFADVNGNYVLPNAGSSPVNVTATATGQYFDLFNWNGTSGSLPPTAITQSITPPGPGNFLFNAANTSEFARGEVNAYIHANVVRNFILVYNPTYPVIAGQTGFDINVNRNSTCNAFYNGSSINFYRAGGACTNTANSTVVYHEYGHHLVASGGSGQGAYGEGFGDVLAVIVLDDSCLGSGFNAPCGTCLRNANNNCQYIAGTSCSSCGSEIHDCGRLISGCVWSTRTNLVVTNPGAYRQIINDLCINSVLLHTGTLITPQITIDFLTLDDNDGNIGNGTPHYNEINNGFTAHNMPGPPLAVGISVSPTSNFTSGGAAGGPFIPASQIYTVENVENTPLNYQVTASQPWITLTNPSGTLAAHATVQVTVGLNANSLANGVYTGTVNFTNLTSGLGNTSRSVSLEIGRALAYNFPMDINPNWTFTGPTTNGWAFGHPVGLGGDPANGYTGANVIGFNLNGQYPNNQPEYTATSGPINCSGLTGVQVKFRRWLGVESSTWDHARFQISTNGTTWTNIYENPATSLVETAWSPQSYDIPQADGQAALRLRWTMGTTDTSVTYCGWNIDDVQIWGIPPASCLPDTNGDQVVDVNDLLAVINAWGTCPQPCPPYCAADVNHDCAININDLLAVINAWGPCP